MSAERRGILAGGNWILDRVSIIDRYPDQDHLAYILGTYRSNGGSPYNVLKDLSRLEAPFPLAGVGLIGNDEAGRYILADCADARIDTGGIVVTDDAPTSYTEVMSVKSTGRRTFFHQPGANRLLDEYHFDLASESARIFHLGYLLLLDRLDIIREDGTTPAALLLNSAKDLGFQTSVDLVSAESDRYEAVVGPALPFIDYLFLNELEARRLTGIATTSGDLPEWEGIARAGQALIERGVGRLVCIHASEGILVHTAEGREFRQASVPLSAERIVSTVGAGDALAAGMLLGLHEDWPIQASMRLGVAAAATCLSHAACSEGVLPWQRCLDLADSAAGAT
jgi:sugar/nucleoside kinase (ribokinase family)